MKITWQNIKINGVITSVKATEYEKEDKILIRDLYFQWKKLNDAVKLISTRGINLPEVISENAFCLFFKNCIRVVKLKQGKCSYDVLNTKTGSRIQIKASSISEDLTSFGPRSEWDELYFLDFCRGDGTFDAYAINKDLIYNHMVNVSQSFEDQQRQGKRPRFSIKKVIEDKNICPTKTCSLI